MKPRGIEKVLVTGGAGFIGSHTVDLLVSQGYEASVFDSLESQVHGVAAEFQPYVSEEAKRIRGDIHDLKALESALEDVDAVVHLAAMVGVGQSMYEVRKYVDSNTTGTAGLLDIIIRKRDNIRKLVVASSMSIYGEGEYHCSRCEERVFPSTRDIAQLEQGDWEQHCPRCGSVLEPVATREDKPLAPSSIYAQSKRHQEEMSLLVGETYGIPTVALRYFNVFGSRQALSNPYTGVTAIFLCRIMNGNQPYIFEDGKQSRDFIHVSDVAKANLLGLEKSSADYRALNVGTGSSTSVLNIAKGLIMLEGRQLRPQISQKYRKGDIRHCFADISQAKKLLGFSPEVSLAKGLAELCQWGLTESWTADDHFQQSLDDLCQRGLASITSSISDP